MCFCGKPKSNRTTKIPSLNVEMHDIRVKALQAHGERRRGVSGENAEGKLGGSLRRGSSSTSRTRLRSGSGRRSGRNSGRNSVRANSL